jgi:flagellar motor switch protein FliM
MAEEISDEDLRALLASAGRSSPAPSTTNPLGNVPLAYDFKRPQRLSKEQLRLIENIHEQFARLCSSSLAASMRMVIDVQLAFTDQVLYGEFIVSLPNPCSAYSFSMDPPGGPAVLSFSPELLMAVIDRAFGGKGQGFSDEPRALTRLEIGVVNKLVNRILGDLEATWEVAVPVRIADVVMETSPDFIRIAASGDAVMLVAFEAHSSHVSGLVHLCYPLTTLNPLLPQLSPQHQRRTQPSSAPSPALRYRALGKVKVPVVVQVARGSLPLREVAGLKPGDVIVLDTAKDEPAVIFLGKQPKFLGRPGLDGRQRAIKITEFIPEDQEELYL